jgi:hypothetical protein
MSRRARYLIFALGAVVVAGAGLAGWLIMRSGETREFVETYIGDVSLVYPSAYARFPAGKTGGRSNVLELAAALPDFRPAGDASAALNGAAGGAKPALLFLSLSRPERKVDPAELVAQLYARFLDPEIAEADSGLLKRSFQDSSPYAGEDLYFAAPEGRAFAARCPRPRIPPDGLPETCIATFRQGDLDVDYRFDRSLLSQWERMSDGARALVRSMLPR